MKKTITIITFFSVFLMYGQTQLGFFAETNSYTVKTDDLCDVESRIGYGFGISGLFSLYQSADFIAEISFSSKRVYTKGYIDFYGEKNDFENQTFNVSDIHANGIFNQYLIIPDMNKVNIAVQGGLGISILNDWVDKKNDMSYIFYDTTPLNFFYIVGISTGTEQIRATLRYNGNLSNVLKGVKVTAFDDASTNREFIGKLNGLSLSFTYYFTSFGY